jgi:hypothetical protein
MIEMSRLTSKGVGERTTCESGGGARKSEVKFISPLGVPSSASSVDDSAGGQGFPRLVEPRFFVQVRKIERWRMIAAVTPRRLVEGQGMGQTQEERHWRCGTDSGGMKMTRRGVRCCSALSGSGYHRVGPIRCSSPKYCQYIVGSTTGTILYRLGAILRQQFYNLVMSLL